MKIGKLVLLLFFLGTVLALEGRAAPDEKKEKVKNPVSTYRPDETAKIQRDLQEIIRIHQSLQLQHQQEIKEIQRIMEQARIHQQLLKNLAPVRPIRPPVNQEEALRLEKIRLIQRETAKNRRTLKAIQEKAGKEAQAKSTQAKSSQRSPPAPENPKKSFWGWTQKK